MLYAWYPFNGTTLPDMTPKSDLEARRDPSRSPGLPFHHGGVVDATRVQHGDMGVCIIKAQQPKPAESLSGLPPSDLVGVPSRVLLRPSTSQLRTSTIVNFQKYSAKGALSSWCSVRRAENLSDSASASLFLTGLMDTAVVCCHSAGSPLPAFERR